MLSIQVERREQPWGASWGRGHFSCWDASRALQSGRGGETGGKVLFPLLSWVPWLRTGNGTDERERNLFVTRVFTKENGAQGSLQMVEVSNPSQVQEKGLGPRVVGSAGELGKEREGSVELRAVFLCGESLRWQMAAVPGSRLPGGGGREWVFPLQT